MISLTEKYHSFLQSKIRLDSDHGFVIDRNTLDPFGGLMTVPYVALQKRRKGIAIELNKDYFSDGCAYLKAEEMKMAVPTLFDVLKAEVA